MSLDPVDDAFAEVVRILMLGEQWCQIAPWGELEEAERARWIPRGRRYRAIMEARGIVVTALSPHPSEPVH